MSTSRYLQLHYATKTRPYQPRRAMSPLRVGILLGVIMAAFGLVALGLLWMAVRGIS